MSTRPTKGAKSEDQLRAQPPEGSISAEISNLSGSLTSTTGNKSDQHFSLARLTLEELHHEDDALDKSIQRQGELNKRELKYELLLDLRSKISK